MRQVIDMLLITETTHHYLLIYRFSNTTPWRLKMPDNKHLIEMNECETFRDKIRKSITTLLFWIVGGLAAASLGMFGLTYNKVDSFCATQTVIQLEAQRDIGGITADIANIKEQLNRLLILQDTNNNNHVNHTGGQ